MIKYLSSNQINKNQINEKHVNQWLIIININQIEDDMHIFFQFDKSI